jgi:hypothetical protein
LTTDNKDPQDTQRIFMTFQEAQEFLGVSHQTLYKLMKEGLPSHKISKKRVFLKEDLIKDKRALDLSVTIALVLLKKLMVPWARYCLRQTSPQIW